MDSDFTISPPLTLEALTLDTLRQGPLPMAEQVATSWPPTRYL